MRQLVIVNGVPSFITIDKKSFTHRDYYMPHDLPIFSDKFCTFYYGFQSTTKFL